MSKLNKLIQELCPNGVEYRKLGEVANLYNGYAFKSKLYSSTGIRIIRISDVQKGKISDKECKYYPLDLERDILNYILYTDDIVISLTGNCGRVAMIEDIHHPVALNQRVAALRVSRNILSKFLFYILDSDEFENKAMENAFGAGQKNLSTKWI